ncbi:MAG: helix-turn-helix domain-containing protein [Firmicutes bacterium]|nr:helix-turn-helix domain-containing protein [Bacillota bacterium]
MIGNRIRDLRESAGYSQSQLAKKLDVSRSAVNAWEMGLSAPTTQFIVAMARLFHVSSDYILGLDNACTLRVEGYSEEEMALLYRLLQYIDQRREAQQEASPDLR